MQKLPEFKHHTNPFKRSIRISSIYFAASSIWIILSDIMNIIYQKDTYDELYIEIGKGLLFVTVTAVLLFFLLKKNFVSLQKSGFEVIQSEKKYRTLAENLEFSLTRHDRENKYIYINNSGWNMLRELCICKSIEEFYGKTPYEVYKDKFLADIVIENNKNVFSTGKTLKLKLHYGDKYYSYSKIPEFNSDGEVVSVLSVISDETEIMYNLIHLKKAEEELTRKSEYLNAVIEASPMSIFDLDPEGNVLSIWNKASEEIFGWKAEEVIGRQLPIVPEERKNEFSENIKTNFYKKHINGNEHIRNKKDGSEIAIKIYSRPVISKEGNVEAILAYNEDITLQKKYNEGIKKNEEYLKLLYEASLAVNDITNTNDLYSICFDYIEKILNVTGIIVSLVYNEGRNIKYEAIRVNGQNIDVSDLPLTKLRPDGKGPQTHTILTGKPVVIKDLEEMLKDSQSKMFVDTEGHVCDMNGEVENVSRAAILLPLKYDNRVIGVLQVQNYKADFYTEDDLHKLEPFAFIFSSALQRNKLYNKAQTELVEKEAAYEQVRKFSKGIEQSPNSIVITNSNYEIEYVNPYFTELTGYTYEEVLGKNPNVLKSGQTKKEVYEDLWKTLAKGETWHGEFLNLKKSGQLYWESASIGPITDINGKITHYIAIKQDITEKKKKDKQLKDSLEEKEIMLKEIHHRVKNNLQVISSLLNMQVEQYDHPEAIEAINSSRNRVKAMALVHENLYRSHNIAKTSFKEYIIMLAKNIYSSYGVSFERVKFLCDTNAIEFGLDTIIPLGLILNEAISNSLKHAFPENANGQINISVIEQTGDTGDKSYTLRIKDNGKGLPQDFNPGQTNSLGMVLLTSLSSQLDGNTVIKNKVGTEIIINFKELKYKSRV